MDERKIQKNFIDQIKGKKKVKKSSIGVYKYLVNHAFYEVLVSAYPEFYKIIQTKKLNKEFHKSMYKFMQTKAYSPYIWQMPNEYRKFLKKSKYFKKLKYLNDLLHFEYSELSIFMKEKQKQKNKNFQIKHTYKLSKNAILHKYEYDVVNNNFEVKYENFLLGYFDYNTQEVVYRPLNELLFSFLKSINKNKSLKINLKIFLSKHNISYKKHSKDFSSALKEIYKQKVLV